MTNWYFKKKDGPKTGPYSIEQIHSKAQKHPDGFAMQEGVSDWKIVTNINELGLQNIKSQSSYPGNQPGSVIMSQRIRDEESEGVDYRIYGTEMQFVEIELDPNESIIAEAGAMMYKDPSIEMETIFGDGSENKGTGFLGLLAGAGRHLITGESMFTTVFTHHGQGKSRVSFAAPYPGNIIPVMMKDFDGTLVCQKDAFLCASKGIAIGIYFSKKIMTGLFGGEGFILQKLTSNHHDNEAISFIQAGGTIIEKVLQQGQTLEIDTGCLVAMTANIDFDVKYIGNIKSAFFGGEGFYLGILKANTTGKVWLQSLPFSRLAGRILATARGDINSRDGGEGSLLGGLGDFINGDNR